MRQHGAAVSAALAHAGLIGGASPTPAPPIDAVFVPVGGGSLLAGIASAVKMISPSTKVSKRRGRGEWRRVSKRGRGSGGGSGSGSGAFAKAAATAADATATAAAADAFGVG